MKQGAGFKVVRLGGLELPTFWFVARRSIQLSYRRTVCVNIITGRRWASSRA
jgi:hypothetical protein